MLKILVALLMLAPPALRPLSIFIRPEGFAPSPGSATIQVHLAPNKGNRQLDVLLVNQDTEWQRLSTISLDGAEARTTHTYFYKNLEPGRYIGVAQLTQVQGSKVTQVHATSKRLEVTE